MTLLKLKLTTDFHEPQRVLGMLNQNYLIAFKIVVQPQRYNMSENNQVTMFEMLKLQHTFTSFNESRKLQTNTAFNA